MIKPKNILLIANPVSGRTKSKTALFDILDELYRAAPVGEGVGSPVRGRRVVVCPTMHRGHATELSAQAAADGFDTVICCGGDGTLNETISGLLRIPADSRPALGYIPAGSTNDFAASMGLSSSLRDAARTAVDGGETAIDIGHFQPVGTEAEGESAPTRYFSYIASFGIFTASSYTTPQSVKNVMGHAAYVLEGAKDLTNIRSHHAVFEADGDLRVEGDYIFAAVTNTTSAGGVVKLPANLVSMSDGELEVLLIHTPRTVADLNKIITALWASDFENCPLIEFFHAGSVTVTLNEPLRWSLDGEEGFGGTKVRIHCLPRAIRLKTN